jgi:hypothetical protein
MHRILFTAFYLTLFFPVKAQMWDSLSNSLNGDCRVLYSDSLSGFLYAAGKFTSAGNLPAKGIARWDGAQWDSLGAGIDGLDHLNLIPQNTLAITKFNTDLYVGGGFSSLGNTIAPVLGMWNGTAWSAISPQPFPSNATAAVYTLEVIDNELYIGGAFDTIAGLPCKSFAKWNGAAFIPLSLPPAISSPGEAIVTSICAFNDDIYIAGNFGTGLPGDTLQDIMRLSSEGWSSVGGGIRGSLSNVQSMTVFDGELFVAGYFLSADGNAGNHIQKWNGSAWSDVGGGVNPNGIFKLLTFNNKLYAFGAFEVAGGEPAQYLALWNGTDWCSLGSSFDNGILTGAVFNDSLYIGGSFTTIDDDSIGYISKWTGGVYTESCGNSTDIEKYSDQSALHIWPNPSNSCIVLKMPPVTYKNHYIQIYDINGQRINQINCRARAADEVTIDISGLSPGIYFLQLQLSEKTYSTRFIKS